MRVWLTMRQAHSASYPQWGVFDWRWDRPTQPPTLSDACLTDDEAGPLSLLPLVRRVWLTMRQAYLASYTQWGMFDWWWWDRLDHHANSTSVSVKFRGMVTMLILNMSRHVSMMTHTYHKVMIHCMTQYLHNQYESWLCTGGQSMSHANMLG